MVEQTGQGLLLHQDVVYCTGDELKRYFTHPDHHRLLAMRRQNILLRPGRSLPENLYDLRVVESLLIQSRATRNETRCDYCETGKGLYRECRTIMGWSGEACGGCKRNDWAAQCTLSTAYKETKSLV